MTGLPLVSAIMPTRNRRHFVPQAIRNFQRQDYPNKELLIVDDGTDRIIDLVPEWAIYFGPEGWGSSIGAKRNHAIDESYGDLIIHWDDDDWMAPHRISHQVEMLGSADICGLATMTYLDIQAWTASSYHGPRGRPWMAGGSMLYRKSLWERHPFPDANIGEDAAFLDAHASAAHAYLLRNDFYVAIRHAGNTNPQKLSRRWVDPPDLWKPVPLAPVISRLGDDWAFYESLSSSPYAS